ncbi:T9SS type B sorting domain-containing protein [Tenacibaculum sp. 1_MG-2023]|uniref:T9SS type B sorting domain-containing protein n=1 Tax=Tenacibaculum sp. 1_MG-2023 TaxID=3062653 RepID=UPI0026E1E791|nr:T9SS type B sorting domain-containing protein [Tenacibaculum sp. 1_MG-2023]MDO6674546.1 T9SS type B sorting domain-containing protein [Tenacibaculum sp. 1_MG-2023]
MKKQLLLALFFIVSISSYSQKEANIWYFGNNAGLDFNSGNPVTLNDGLLKTDEGCSTISDENGNLLFYSDGINVWTKNHELMHYSSGGLADNLQGNPSSSQSGLIVPNPEDKNLYYIFTVGTNFIGNLPYPDNPGFKFYTIDISKGNGGEIISGPVNLADSRDFEWSEKVTAVQGKDCKEIWALSIVQNTFYAYKIDKNGVDSTNPIISTSSYFLRDKRGYLKVSPDGTKVALADFTNDGSGRLVLYNFDNATGKVDSNGLILTDSPIDGSPYGVEFSQQSTKLYTSLYHENSNSFRIFQYDLLDSNIPQTKTQVHQEQGYRGALQLAPNGKIYASIPERNHLGAIENPEDNATDIQFTSNAVSLGGARSSQGLPPFIQSFFAPVKLINLANNEVLNNSNQIFCIGESYQIQPEKNNPSDTYTWFKDGTEVANTRVLTIDNINYGSGLYEIQIESNSYCKKTYTGKVQITFEPKPTINTLPPYIQCDFDNNTIDGFTTFNLEILEKALVKNLSEVTIDFFETSDTSFSTPLNKNNYTNLATINHSITVRVTNNTTQCYQTDVVNLQVNPTGLTSYTNEYIHELDQNASNPDAKFSVGTNNGFFDFSLKTQKIINSSGGTLSDTTHDFQYYRTAKDASLQTNQIVLPYQDDLFTDNSDVYVRISNKGATSCEAVGSFKIFVEKIPVPQGNLNDLILCVDNPRTNPQPKRIHLNADTGNPTDTYKWYLNNKLISGETSPTYNANASGEYKVEAYRKHPNISTSYLGYNTFFVKESNQALVINIKSVDDRDSPESNKIEITVDGIGDYEYALNSTNLSDFVKGNENLTYTFTDIPPGLNSISIRDRNGCGITTSNQISTIYFQRHFTPNGDGNFDTWKILGVNNNYYDVVKVQIFNRYGKLINEITDKNHPGWDGVYNGTTLPTNDYWYNAELIDSNGKVRKKTGHFSLLRK